jgi:enoyl-CoA hydratase/carnithine racemase
LLDMKQLITDVVAYEFDGAIATITMDDGRVNVMSLTMLGAINDALDQAVADDAVVVLQGREGVFSAGFDLAVLQGGAFGRSTMVRAGFELVERMLAFPRPIVAACTGHAIAMGTFLLFSADHRVGAEGPFKLVANEVAIGITMPHAALAVLRSRLTPAVFERAAVLAETFSPSTAVATGFLDEVAAAADVSRVAHDVATRLATLDPAAHAATKVRARAATLQAIREGTEADFNAFRAAS